MKKTLSIEIAILCMLIKLSLLTTICFADKPDLIITTWCGPPFATTDNSGYFDLILDEAFGRMGLKIDIKRRPAERSLHDANLGKVDGEFIRVEQIGKLYPNLMIVPEYLYNMEFVAFTKRDGLVINNGWKSLEKYKVGIVLGWKILEQNVIYSKGPRSDITRQELLFGLLDRNRIEVAVYSKQFGIEEIERLGLTGIKIIEPPFTTNKMYLFLHKKHKEKIPIIQKILKRMKEDGDFKKIREKTLIGK